MIPQLDEHTITPECFDESCEFASRCRRTIGHERRHHGAITFARERPPVARSLAREIGNGAARFVLATSELRQTQRASEMRVTTRAIGHQHDLVRAITVVHRHIGAEHRGQLHRARRFGESHDAVQPVAIGERECVQAEAMRFFGEFFGVRGAVEEREVRVAVQFGVRHDGAGCGLLDGWLIGLAHAPERRAVTAGVARGGTGGATVPAAIGRPTTRQPGLEFRPGRGPLHSPRVGHGPRLSNICSYHQGRFVLVVRPRQPARRRRRRRCARGRSSCAPCPG